MKKIVCFFILIGLVSLHPVLAGNKKSSGGGKSSGARSFSGGSHASGASHMNTSQHSFRSNSVHTSHTANAVHGNSAVHAQTAHGLNASHGVAAQHGLNASHGNFQSGRGLSAHGSNARFAGHNGNYAGHFRNYHEAFSGYHRQYHDRYWWHDHYDRVVIVGGGSYYWDGGYWYPAWGYDPAFVAYAYDGPIYSYENLPPDQVVVNVQDALQDQGYYTGEVDGQLGPKTRDAIGAYQQDHGLDITSAVDEPTVDALGLG